MEPKISVVMCVYNRADKIKESIKSIINQTFKDWELIIIDDGSEEDIGKVVSSFKDSRIVYKRLSENSGVPVARNIGNSMARGEFIAVADSDDINFPKRLQAEYDTLIQNPEVDVVYSSAWIIYPDDNGKVVMYEAHDWDTYRMIYDENLCFHPTIMFRKSVLKDTKYTQDYRFGSDYVFMAELALKGYKFKKIKEPLIRYTRHNKSISRENKSGQTNMSREGINKLLAKYPLPVIEKKRGINDFDYPLSIIIPAYNNTEELEVTLFALSNQDSEKDSFEIIVCDDGGSEETLKLIQEFISSKGLNINYFWNPDRGYTLCNVRNAGLKLANGRIIAFLDADMKPCSDFVKNVILLHSGNDNLLAIHARNQIDSDGCVISLEDRSLNLNEAWRMMGGGNISIRKSNAEIIGLFDVNYNLDWGLEDIDWALRARDLGINIIYAPHIIASHQGVKTFKETGKNKIYHKNKWKL
jgi:glycosyltransferase involved in cell wall biosynthesis